MPLEDEFSDIIKKARTGQGLTVGEVAASAGLSSAALSALERGEPPCRREDVHAIAKALGLRGTPLEQIALQGWVPAAPSAARGLETVLGSIGGYEVKGYVLYDSGEAVLVDTGYNPTAMIEVLDRNQLRLRAICLTHGHADHADGLETILAKYPAPVYLGPDDVPLLSWHPPTQHLLVPQDGETISLRRLTMRFMTTPGHTPGGICYRVESKGLPMCFVGDTLFAGSIGRSNPASLYQQHLDSVRRRVLTLPEDAGLYPGHGPATTVREELAHNPFAS